MLLEAYCGGRSGNNIEDGGGWLSVQHLLDALGVVKLHYSKLLIASPHQNMKKNVNSYVDINGLYGRGGQ